MRVKNVARLVCAAAVGTRLAIGTAVVASAKGRSAFGWLILGCLFSLLALILVACLPSLKQPALAPDAPRPDTHVRCPDRKEFVLNEANVCKHCGAKLIPQSKVKSGATFTSIRKRK